MVDRVSTASLHRQNLSDMQNMFSQLADLNKQISSGRIADNFADLNGSVERISGLETRTRKAESYISSNDLIETRLNLMNQSIEQLQQVAQDFASSLTLRRNPAAERGFDFTQNAEATLTVIVSQLNINVEGRYLFSGSKTDTAPVATPVPNLVETGVADSGYYNGDTVQLTARISDSFEIQYGVTADDSAFQNLIAAVKTGIAGDSADDDSILGEAVGLINAAIEDLAVTRAKVNSNILAVQDATDQHESLNLFWKEGLSDEIDTDIAAASIRVATNETILQATFQTFARLSELSLTRFLN